METDEDVTAFDGLYDMHRNDVYRFACALSGDDREAEDLFQETWLRAVKAGPPLGPAGGGDPKAWLFAIAANAHRDLLRRKRVRRLFLFERTRRLAEGGADADRGWDAAGREGADAEERSDLRLCLRRAVARLPGRERRVFVLKDVEGFKHGEIARMLGLPEATVRTLLHRAVGRLRKELAEFGPARKGQAIFEEERP